MSGPPTAIVLAAGAGRRFGGGKLLARLDGRPVLQHVLDALAAAGIDDPVVVVGADEPALAAAILWRRARRITNATPERGLSSSLQLGWDAAMAARPSPRAVLVALGDQPRLDPAVVRALLAQPADPARPVVAALHAEGSRNPVRLEPEAGPFVAAAAGDRGLGPLLDAHPELVRMIVVAGSNPDVDRPADLSALIAAGWAARVRANADQVERVREIPDGRDFYATVSRTFLADPAREGDPVLDALLALARPNDTWLDIGAGAGRYALPLARHVRQVVALDPSTSMLAALRDSMAGDDVGNVHVVQGRWPSDPALRTTLGPDPLADVALIAHVGYDVVDIVAFVDAMEATARRQCVAVLMSESPASIAAPFWPLVHGEERVGLPAMDDFVELLTARGARPAVSGVAAERRRWADDQELLAFLRRQLWTLPGSAADARLLEAAATLAATDADGGLVIRGGRALDIGIVAWSPTILVSEDNDSDR